MPLCTIISYSPGDIFKQIYINEIVCKWWMPLCKIISYSPGDIFKQIYINEI